MEGVDPQRYVLGFELLEEWPPTVRVYPSDNKRNDDPDMGIYPPRLAITFGRVRLTDPRRWGEVEEVHLQLVTSENNATYCAFRDDSYAYQSRLWRRSLLCVQNPELNAFTSWL